MFSTLRLHFHQSDSFNALTFSSPPPTTDFQYHFTVDQTSGIPVFTFVYELSIYHVPAYFHFSNSCFPIK